MPILFNIIIAALAESIASFSGAALAILNYDKVKRYTHYIISFAVGALLGVSFFELIPEALANNPAEEIMPIILVSIILFFALEQLLFWHHCHHEEHRDHQPEHKAYGQLILWGDFLHNFIDGIIIALAFMASPTLGLMATIAIIFHEIPQEIADFGILIHSGFTKKQAFLFNFLVSLSTLAGALLTYLLGNLWVPLMPYALALVAGNFIYLAAVDLMPELHESTSLKHNILQLAFIILGVILVTLPGQLFGHG